MDAKVRAKLEKRIAGRDVILHRHAETLLSLARLRVGECKAWGLHNHRPYCNPALHEVVEQIDRELAELKDEVDGG